MNPGINGLLERQLKRIYGTLDKVPKEAEALIAIVSETYNHNEEDRALIERSMEISSKELSELNRRLQNESSALRNKLAELESITRLEANRQALVEELQQKVAVLEGAFGKSGIHETPKPPTQDAPQPTITL